MASAFISYSSDDGDSDDEVAIVKEWQDRGPFNRFNQLEHRLAHDNFDVGIYDFPDDDEYEEYDYLSDEEEELEEYIDKVQAGTKVQVSGVLVTPNWKFQNLTHDRLLPIVLQTKHE